MTHVIVLVDTSYSMQIHADNLISGLNNFISSLASQRSTQTYMSVVFFNDDTTYIHKAVPILNVPRLTVKDIGLYGSTLLYDSINNVLADWLMYDNIKHHMYVITDGDDTGSKMSKNTIEKACENAVENFGWSIIHCGVDTNNLNTNCVRNVVYDLNNIDTLLSGLII